MLTFINSFRFSIIIHNNIIDVTYNIDEYIKKYINNNMLYKQKKGVILYELKSYSYSHPKSLPNIIYNCDRFKIFIEATFNCVLFVQEMIINDLVLNTNNKIEKLAILSKSINEQLNITCIDKHNNKYTCTDYAVIKKINYINNNVNIIIEKYTNTINKIHFNTDFDKNNNLINIIKQNIDKSFMFNVDNKPLDYISLIKHLSTLKKKTNYIMSIDLKKITLTENTLDIIPEIIIDQYFNNILINLYNYYIFYAIKK